MYLLNVITLSCVLLVTFTHCNSILLCWHFSHQLMASYHHIVLCHCCVGHLVLTWHQHCPLEICPLIKRVHSHNVMYLCCCCVRDTTQCYCTLTTFISLLCSYIQCYCTLTTFISLLCWGIQLLYTNDVYITAVFGYLVFDMALMTEAVICVQYLGQC